MKGQITSDTLWIPFDLKEQTKIETSYIAKEPTCDLITHIVDFQQFALVKKKQKPTDQESHRQLIRAHIRHPQLKKYRPDITSYSLFQNVQSDFFSETKQFKLYLYKILIPDKQKRESFKSSYENQLVNAKFNPIWRGGMHMDFIAYLLELYTTTGIQVPEFIAMNQELMENFQLKAIKFFEKGISVESLNKLILNGIIKEASQIDFGDKTKFSNNWTSAENIALTLQKEATLQNYHEILIKLTTKECFLMYQLNYLLIEKNTIALENLFPFYLFLQVALKIQSLYKQALDNSPINLSNIMSMHQVNSIQFFKKMNLPEQIANQFLTPKYLNNPFSINFFFTPTTSIENANNKKGNILFIINYFDSAQIPITTKASLEIKTQRPFSIKNAAYLDKITYQIGEHEVIFPSGILVKISSAKKEDQLIVISLDLCN